MLPLYANFSLSSKRSNTTHAPLHQKPSPAHSTSTYNRILSTSVRYPLIAPNLSSRSLSNRSVLSNNVGCLSFNTLVLSTSYTASSSAIIREFLGKHSYSSSTTSKASGVQPQKGNAESGALVRGKSFPSWLVGLVRYLLLLFQIGKAYDPYLDDSPLQSLEKLTERGQKKMEKLVDLTTARAKAVSSNLLYGK